MILCCRFRISLPDGTFRVAQSRPTGWTHIVLNYIGPNGGQGISVFINGVQVVSETTKQGGSRSAGDGRIVVGRRYTDRDWDYASVVADELIYFNAALKSDDVQLIYNSA